MRTEVEICEPERENRRTGKQLRGLGVRQGGVGKDSGEVGRIQTT